MKNKAQTYYPCNHTGCSRKVKKKGDACWQHKGLEDQVEAGMVVEETHVMAGIGQEAAPENTLECEDVSVRSLCADCVGDCEMDGTPIDPAPNKAMCTGYVAWVRDDERTRAMLALAGREVSLEALVKQTDKVIKQMELYACAVHFQASDNDDVIVPACPTCLAELAGVAEEQGGATAEPVSSLEEAQEKSMHQKTGLMALLREVPPAPVGLFVPFDQAELEALAESEVTAEHVRTLVMMGLEGKLQPAA